jgi:hypothetical protein
MIRLRNTQQGRETAVGYVGGLTWRQHMQITKLKTSGLIPAGAHFERLATDLRQANAREAKLRAQLDMEDGALEALYRRAPAARSNTFVAEEAYA